MKPSSRVMALIYFLIGFGLMLLGMINEFLLGAIFPSEVMQHLYLQGGFLILIILCFTGGIMLIRRSLFEQWRYRYDSIIYIIAALICLASAIQTILGLQIGHPYLELAETNLILMNLLWIFVLPPLNPWIMTTLSVGFAIVAWMNAKVYPPNPPNPSLIDETPVERSDENPQQWWDILGGLTRVSVWLGSLFLVILSFLILGSPPLSPPPDIPLHQPFFWLRLFVGLISVSLLNSAAFILNQIGDVDTDQLDLSKARLPVSAGRITRNQAALLAVGFIIIGLIMALSLGFAFFSIICFIFIFAIIYSFPPLRLKGRPFFDLLIIGLGFGTWAVLTAWGILTIRSFFYVLLNPGPEIPLILLIGAGFFYAGTHGIHTASDYDADAAAGVKTTAVHVGFRKATKLGISLIALGLVMLYIAVGYFTHLFWYGLLKYKSIFLLIFLGLPFFTLFEQFRVWQQSKISSGYDLRFLQRRGRWVTYLLFLILLFYLVLYVFIFYPTYYPHYFFPWT